jgi:predicted nuclease of predicted toxin-antitoxin system
VKLLFDENLSPSLVRRLADIFPESAHVHELGLGSADDNAISTFAREHDYVVVTKDADFRALRLTFGSNASRVVWIRSGNGSTKAIEQALRSRVQAIRAMAADETGIVDIL